MSFLSLAKALLTLCCLHRSLVFVKIFLVMSRFLRWERKGTLMAKTYSHMFCQEPAMLDLLKSGFKKSILSALEIPRLRRKRMAEERAKEEHCSLFFPTV